MSKPTVTPQVAASHYDFERYLSKPRWASMWHQLDELSKLRPVKVLEVGPGPGVFKAVAATIGINVETIDMDPMLRPDYVGSVLELPFSSGAYDVVCAFQVLEHLPYEQSLLAFREMERVSKSHVLISLPDAKVMWEYKVHLPFFGVMEFAFPRPMRQKKHAFDGEHYWEINTSGYGLMRIVQDYSAHAELLRTFRVPENTYHRFFLFRSRARRPAK